MRTMDIFFKNAPPLSKDNLRQLTISLSFIKLLNTASRELHLQSLHTEYHE
jgi:hypothetical protein